MTALVVMYLIGKNNISFDVYVEVHAKAASVQGTTAKLGENMLIKLIDLLYALMLPSGNDAALVLANYLGSFCKSAKKAKYTDQYKANKLCFIR